MHRSRPLGRGELRSPTIAGASLDVLHLLAQLLDRDLHVDRDRRHLDRRATSSRACWPRAAAPGSGTRGACRSRRPGRAGARSRRGASAGGELLGDVDADRVRRGFVEGALLRSPRASPTARRRPCRAPRCQRSRKRCCWRAHRRRAPAARPRRQARADARRAPSKHRRQPRAFARARLGEALDAARGGIEHGVARDRPAARCRGNHCRTSWTERACACGRCSRTLASMRAMCASCSGVGSGTAFSASPAPRTRSSILPRLKRAVEHARAGPARARATRPAGAARGRGNGR